jgi:hypothetical protein
MDSNVLGVLNNTVAGTNYYLSYNNTLVLSVIINTPYVGVQYRYTYNSSRYHRGVLDYCTVGDEDL